MQTQVPCILTIHFGMSVLDYRCHFDTDNSNFEKCKTVVGGDLTNLMSIYPGHTMDMSGALYQGWRQSFVALCTNVFGIEDVSEENFHAILRLCTVHYKNNVRRVSNIST